MANDLTKELIENALSMLGRLAAREGHIIELAVYGGSCLALATNIRTSTQDIDAVFLTDPTFVYNLAEEVRRTLDLPNNWLNQGVKMFAPPQGNPKPNLIPFGEYPKDGAVGVRVLLPPPQYILAMKLLANRQDVQKKTTDTLDIYGLMKICDMKTEAQLYELFVECFPYVTGITDRLKARIADVIEGFQNEHDQSVEPTWNAGRGHSTF